MGLRGQDRLTPPPLRRAQNEFLRASSLCRTCDYDILLCKISSRRTEFCSDQEKKATHNNGIGKARSLIPHAYMIPRRRWPVATIGLTQKLADLAIILTRHTIVATLLGASELDAATVTLEYSDVLSS